MPDLRDWIGREREAEDILALRPADTLRSILSAPPDVAAGLPLPPLWHWLYFPEVVSLARTGPDGHPERGDFLPPVPLPRRMWAGGQLSFLEPLHFGETVRRQSKIANVVEKLGSSGPLCFVTVQHRLFSNDRLCIEEQQDIVYRGDASGPPPAIDPVPLAPADCRETVQPTSVMLFRFSAATANSHRIHFDREYAVQVEKYAGLVVHGPLTASLLADLARRTSGRELATFRFRGQRPLFDTSPFTIAATVSDSGLVLRAEAPDGHVAMQADATLK